MQSWYSGFRLADGAAVIADRGYDSQRNNDYAHRSGGIPVIHKRRPPGGRRHDGIYTTDGVPTGLGRVEMEYVCTDPDTGHCRAPLPGRLRCAAGAVPGLRRLRRCGVADPGRNLRWFGGRIWSSGVSMRRQQPGGEPFATPRAAVIWRAEPRKTLGAVPML